MNEQVLGQSADWFAQKLRTIGACDAATTALAGQTLEQAWATCQNGGWMLFWLSSIAYRTGYTKHVKPAVHAEFSERLGVINATFRLVVGYESVAAFQPDVADFLRARFTPEGNPVPKIPLHVRLYDLLTNGQRSYYTQFYLAQATGAPEASVRRSIQTLRKAHNISFSDGYGGGYRLLQGA